MEISKTLNVFIGVEDVQTGLTHVSGKLHDRMSIMIDSKGAVKDYIIGTGTNPMSGHPAMMVLISQDNILGLFIGEDPIEILDFVKERTPYPIHVSLAIAQRLMRITQELKIDFIKSEHSIKRYGDTPRKFGHEYYGGSKPPKPTNEDRTLSTISGTDCISTLAEFMPSRESFVKASKKLLKGEAAMIMVAISRKENVPDTKYMCAFRIGEVKNDPLDTQLLGMVAYQPEVLKNAVIFNPDIQEDVKEAFEIEYNEHFNF